MDVIFNICEIILLLIFFYFEIIRRRKYVQLQNDILNASIKYYHKHVDDFEYFKELQEINNQNKIVYSFRPIIAEEWLDEDSFNRLKDYLPN